MTVTRSEVDEAHARWRSASASASKLGAELFAPGSGYGDPDALMADQHRVQAAKDEAERLFQDYDALSRRFSDERMLALHRSQHRATWASFTVALVVGVATVWNIIVELMR